VDLDALGQALAARKEELKTEIQSEGLPTPIMRTMKGAEVEHGRPVA
jgi:hypothetical protein